MLENKGKKWDDEEEKVLLSELEKKIDIEMIAQNHKRTIGGIRSRIKSIAYNFYKDGFSKEEIMNKTKLNIKELNETIEQNEKKDLNLTVYNLYKEGISMEKIMEKTKLTQYQILEIIETKKKKKPEQVEEFKTDIEILKNHITESIKILVKKNEEEIQLIRETNAINNARFEENIFEIKKDIKNLSDIMEKILKNLS
jgi:predicted glycoside hydrolase/deacetylase ChbG (UPF0249 family)